LSTVANAFEAGVPIARLAELRQLRGSESLTAPLGAYLDLVARGAAPDRAWNRITDLAKHRAADAVYVKLSPTDLDQDLPPPESPDENNRYDEAPVERAWTLFTGSGNGQLDQLAGGSLSSFGGSIRQPIGALRFRFDGAAADHAGLGTTGVINAGINYPFSLGSWHVSAGPEFASGRDIGAAWQQTAGLLVGATRSIGAWTLSGSLRGGIAWHGAQNRLWSAQGLSATVRLGDFRFGGSWRGASAADSSLFTALVVDTIAAPIDSVPYPPGGIVVIHREDTTYREQNRHLNDLSLSSGWSRGALSLQGRIGRRVGIGQQGETWWSLGGTVRLSDAVGLTLNSSRTPSDPLLHLRGGHATTIGLRLFGSGVRSHIADAPSASVEVHRVAARLFDVVFVMPAGTHRAAIAGDVTDWHTDSLSHRSDGRWEIQLTAVPGMYRINIQRDDGEWEVPPGLPAAADGFGGRVGLLVLNP
jgi:hypothetical protein